MKKLLVLLTLCILAVPSVTAHASGISLGGTGTSVSPPSGSGGSTPVGPTGGGGGGGSSSSVIVHKGPTGYIEGEFSGSVGDESASGEFEGNVVFPYEAYEPKVTRLHSVNAIFADAEYAVYFLPLLEDFPSDLSTLALNTVSSVDGSRHQFAIVYDGDYDREVMYQEAISTGTKMTHYTTSKKVFSENYNSRALNLLGYDLLLQEESYAMSVVPMDGEYILWADYSSMPISDRQPIYAQTAVMDIYKALGVYEWDIKFAFCKVDEDRYGEFDINTHPIVTQLPALTGVNDTQGVDISELETYVAATRTNPYLYWQRAQRDCLFIGGIQGVSADEVGVTGATGLHLSSMSVMSYIDFLTLCANMMYLYGEPVLTASEAEAVMNSLQITIPASCSKEQYAALTFLVAKGIVGSDELDGLSNNLQYSRMLNILLRVADTGSRLTYKQEYGYMFNQGYVSVNNASIIDNVQHFSFDNTDYYNWTDYLIEKVDDVTRFYVQASTPDAVVETSVNVSTIKTDSSELRFNASNLTYEDRDYYGYKRDGSWYSITHESGGVIEWLSDVEINGREFYHLRVDSRVFPDGLTLGLWDYQVADGDTNFWTFSGLTDNDVIYPHQVIMPYTVGAGGGAILYENGTLQQYPFDSVNFGNGTVRLDLNLMDSNRLQQFSGNANMSGGIVMDVFLVNENMSPADLPIIVDGDDEYNYRNLCTSTGFREGSGIVICPGKMFASVINHTDDGYWQIEIQTNTTQTSVRPTDHNPFASVATMTDLEGFYRNSDGTLLVSMDSLLDKGVVSFYSTFSNGYVLTLANTTTSVTLYQGDDRNYAYIGETMLMLPSNEVLYEIVDNKLYINYKACTGWAASYVAVYNKDYVTYYASNVKRTVMNAALKLPYSASGTLQLSSTYTAAQMTDFPIDMMANNPVSNYLLVQQTDSSYSDVLFVVRMSEASGLSGSPTLGDCVGVSNHLKGQEAINLFTQVTKGLDYSPPEYCELHAYVLEPYYDTSPPDNADVIMNTIPSPIISTQYGKEEEIRQVFGYVYYLNYRSSLSFVDLFNEGFYGYHMSETKRLIPLAGWPNGSKTCVVNLNLNRVKLGNVEATSPVGQFIAIDLDKTGNGVSGSSLKLHELVMQSNGEISVQKVNDNEITNNYVIIPAPTGCFSQLRGLAFLKAGSVDSTQATDRFFYGSALAMKYKNSDAWTLSNYDVDLSDVDWYCVYYSPFGSIYTAVTSSFGQVTASYQKSYDSLTSAIGERIAQFDWEKYTFARMVDGLDRWSSVFLIAILNILPRIGILLFLLLILLACASHLKLMRIFCNRVFDVYKALTFGHMTIDTCDAKKLLITSIFAIAIFSLIMDGLVIQITSFVCNGFVEFIHR